MSGNAEEAPGAPGARGARAAGKVASQKRGWAPHSGLKAGPEQMAV